MNLALLRLEVRIGEGPRARRRTVRKILEKIHRHFNVSVAEDDRPGPASDSVLGFAAVDPSRKDAREVLDRVAELVSAHPRVEVLKVDLTEL